LVKLEWEDGTSRTPAKTRCGSYAVYLNVGGSMGPTYVAGWHPTLGGLVYVADPRNTVDEAKADCQAHVTKLQEAA